MIGAPPGQDEQARLSGARGEFVASLPRRLEVLRAALRAVEDQPRDAGRINGFLRRLHALGSAARVLGFASVAEALGEAEKTLRKVARSGPTASDLSEIARALDLLPSLVLGAKVSIKATLAEEPKLPARDFPLGVLVFGPDTLAEVLTQHADFRVECERTEDAAKARELARTFGPDVALVDADRRGARDLVELFVKDPVVEPIPVVVVGDFASPELSSSFIKLGATRVLPKPVSPDMLRRTLLELRDHMSPTDLVREPLGELNVSQLVERVTAEIRRGLIEAVEPAARTASVSFGEGTDVMGAVWGTVARLRELVTVRSEGNVRFEQTGPEGAVPLAPWNDQRRAGERGAREGRAADGVSLQGRRVVVADDDPAVVWFLAGILKTVGAQVYEAHDGERAFELTSTLWPDLVVSDVLMPKLDGFSLCHEIKRDVAVRDVPVILLSWKEDLLQRVRELGGDADGYLRKEAAASTVVERLREVLRPRARVEQRVLAGGEVRGRLDGLTPRLVLELACRAKRDVRVSFRDSSYLYEVQVRAGAPRTAIRSANDGSFERGEGVLAMLLGVSAGRFVIEPDDSHCRPELSGSLHEQLSGPVARARAAQKSLSAGALASVSRVAFDAGRVGGYLDCTPEPAQSLLRELLGGASPRDLLTGGRAPARLLEAVLSDFARRGAILLVETAAGVEDISQTQVPPAAVEPQPLLPIASAPSRTPSPAPSPAVVAAVAAIASETSVADAEPAELAPVSRRPPPAIYSQPPNSEELESADAGWFSFQIEGSGEPPVVAEPAAAAPAQQIAPVAPAVAAAPPVEAPPPPVVSPPLGQDHPLRRTLSSSGRPAALDADLPGASVPVERGHRPAPRADTLGSAGNEAAAALAAVAAQEPKAELATPPRPATRIATPAAVARPPRPISPAAPPVDDPIANALMGSDTPEPAPAVLSVSEPVSATELLSEDEPAPASPEPRHSPLPALPGLGQTLPLGALGSQTPQVSSLGQTLPLADHAPQAPAGLPEATPALPTLEQAPLAPFEQVSARSDSAPPKSARSENSTVPARVVPRTSSKPAAKPAAPAPVSVPPNEASSWFRTLLLAGVAAAGSYYLVGVVVPKVWGGRTDAPAAPVSHPVVTPVAPSAPAASKLQIQSTDSPLPPDSGVPAGSGLLEIQVAEGTAIRVDGEYLGMGPARRVPLTPGTHSLALGDNPALDVSVKAGQLTSVSATGAAPPARP